MLDEYDFTDGVRGKYKEREHRMIREAVEFPDDCSYPRRPAQKLEYGIGIMGEDYPWEICLDGVVVDIVPCSHCYGEHIHVLANFDGSATWEERVWICPRVVVAYNEGHCNSTGLCLDCILDVAKTLPPFMAGHAELTELRMVWEGVE